MKIGIITFHRANNYGAVLQCYALTEKIKELGHDVFLIDLPLHKKAVSIRVILRNRLISFSFTGFRKNKLTSVVDKNIEIDAYVFGSDQVWNPQITKENFHLYFGSWVKGNIPKIAYAASFGVSEWVFNKYSAEVQKNLNKFRTIGIRESSGGRICSEIFNIESEKVLDPTLLLTDYSNLFSARKKQKSLVVYIFGKDSSKLKEIKKIADDKELKPVLLNDLRYRNGIKSIPFPTVSKWLSYIDSSEFVITDSFHCMVFAVLFRKNFIAIPALPDRIDRMLSLLKDLGLESRFFNSIEEVRNTDIYKNDIDFDRIDNKIKIMRESSLEFLKNSLLEL